MNKRNLVVDDGIDNCLMKFGFKEGGAGGVVE